MYIHIYVCMCIYIYAYDMYIYMHIFTYKYIYKYLYVYIHVYVHVHIYTGVETAACGGERRGDGWGGFQKSGPGVFYNQALESENDTECDFACLPRSFCKILIGILKSQR